MTDLVKVLLVEDSPSDAALLEESLSECGFGRFEFTHAGTLAEAICLTRQADFDVALLDLTLPDSSGRETFLRAQAQAPALPIVVMTGIQDEAIGLEAVRHGIQDYLIKGQSSGRQTSRSIRYAIERKQSEEALKRVEAALQQERAQLEEKVRRRTAELSKLNEALQNESTLRQRAEQEQQLVRRRLSEAQETERGRISRELHDSLGQDLTALKLGLRNLRGQGPFAGVAGDNLAKLEKMTEGLMSEIHRLAWELRPSVLDDMGLDQALQRYCQEWFQITGVPVDFHADGDLEINRLPREFESILYRVAQEALTNVARHARAKLVSVLIERRPGFVLLIVEDDGRGFEAQRVSEAPASPDKLGLLGMQERARLAGGSLSIESTPGTGTAVFARLPLQAGREGGGSLSI
jgi:signal transduction histidine kinase